MIANKGEFTKGALSLAAFFIVLFVMFMPLFKEGNTLNYMDNLYNSISKGSAYYIPKIQEESAAFTGREIKVDLLMASDRQAEETAVLYEKSGAAVRRDGARLTISGDLGAIMENCLADADAMFHNNGEILRNKYEYPEKQALYNWWMSLEKLDFALKKQKMNKESKFVGTVNKKAVECAFNYYTIEPQKITDKLGIVALSLIFYVFYTLWFGFSIMWMFEGWGMRLEH